MATEEGPLLTANMPKRPDFTPTYELIRIHHMKAGHHDWGREKFRRVCIALNETEFEVGMRIGLSPGELRSRIKYNSFRCTEGILLDLHLRWAQEAFTGTSAPGTALAPINPSQLCSTPTSPNPKV